MSRLSGLVFFVAAVSALAAPPDPDVARAKASMARLPLRFEANQGQFQPAVRYAARAEGYTLFLTGRGPVLTFPDSQRVKISLLNSNPTARLEPLDLLALHTNYFVGPREHWHTGVANYGRVRYRDVYPAIDVVYYGSQRQLEYDFVLRPGADAAAIRLQFAGAGHVRITPQGDLELETPAGRLEQKKPVVYQEDSGTGARRAIPGRYTLLARDVVGVQLEAYDRSRPLVIDPVLAYSTYLGGTATDIIYAAQLDSRGFLYVTGSTDTGDLVSTDGTGTAGLTDIILAVFNAGPGGDDSLIHLSYLGGTNLDVARAMAVDAQGYAYLTGTTTSTDFPVVGNAVQTTGAATTVDAFVTVINPFPSTDSSEVLYSTYLGGTQGDDIGNGIAVDQQGHIYVIGTTRSGDFPLSNSPYQLNLYGPTDAFLCEIDVNSVSLVYSTYLGGELSDDGRAIAVDANGLVYFGITTDSSQFQTAGAPYSGSLIGGYDIAIGVMDFTQPGFGALRYSTYFGGSANEEVRKIAFDANGNLLVTGYTMSSDFPVTPDALQPALGGNADAFVAVVNPFNPKFLLYSTYLGGSQGEVAYDVAGDNQGYIYVTGYTLSPDFPVTADAPQNQWNNGIDVFVTKFKPGVPGTAALRYSTYLGGATINVGYCLAVGLDGTAYVAGITGGPFPITANATQSSYGGGSSDGFVLVLTDSQPPPPGTTQNGHMPIGNRKPAIPRARSGGQ